MNVIYKIENPIGEIYIGATCEYKARMSRYKKLHCKAQKFIYKSIKHYGWDKHTVEILEECEKSNSEEREIFYIAQFKSYYKDSVLGLNLTRGGKGERPKGWIPSEETREKWRIINTGKVWDENRKKEFSEFRKSINWKPSSKMRESHKIACSRPIIQIDTAGNETVWLSATEAGNQLGIGRKYIRLCCQGQKETYKNFTWKYKDNEDKN